MKFVLPSELGAQRASSPSYAANFSPASCTKPGAGAPWTQTGSDGRRASARRAVVNMDEVQSMGLPSVSARVEGDRYAEANSQRRSAYP